MTKASTHQHPDLAPDLTDEADALNTLQRLMAQASEDGCSGVMVVYRAGNGENFCVSAGWYSRHREASLRPAVEAVVQLCRGDDEPEPAPHPPSVVLH